MANYGAINDLATAAYLAKLAERSLPAPRSMNRSIAARMARVPTPEPLADQLNRMERRRSLLDNRLDRLTPEQQERSIPLIQRGYEDYLREQRMQEPVDAMRRSQQIAEMAVPGSAAAAALGVTLANAVPEAEEDPAPMTLDDVQWMTMDPADAMPMDEVDLGVPLAIEPDVYVDAEDFDTEGLDELVASGRMAALLPDIEGMMEDDDEALGDAILDGEVSMGDWLDEQADAMFDVAPLARGEELGELQLTRDATPDRDPYMTNAQKRTVQVLMNAGIPSQRAGQIARGEASLSPQEYRMVTGGRR